MLTSKDETSVSVPDNRMPPALLDRNNNFNLIRILLAILVLLSHSYELVDGNRSRELLTRVFGTLSFGELAVDGFFLVSGYLIVQSYLRRPILLDYFKKRVLRIYPAFIAASLVCAFIVGPLGTNRIHYFAEFSKRAFLKGVTLLDLPHVPISFLGTHYPLVNGSMWTIAYEFRCYLFVAFLGIFRICGRLQSWLTISIVALLLSLFPSSLSGVHFPGSIYVLGSFSDYVHFLAFFSAGACFHFLSTRIRYNRSVLLAALVLLPAMFNTVTAQFALVTCGAYLLFSFAFLQHPFLNRFRKLPDVSYGMYLYGWPTQKILLWYIPSLHPLLLFTITCGISWLCGLVSWRLIEQPFLKLKTKPL